MQIQFTRIVQKTMSFAFISVACIATVSLRAGAESTSLASQCVQIKNDTQRLACFDSAFSVANSAQALEGATVNLEPCELQANKPSQSDACISPPAIPKPARPIALANSAGAPLVPPLDENTSLNDISRVAQVESNASEQAAKIKDKIAEFGASGLQTSESEKELDRINAVIADIEQGPRKQRIFTLNNGQIWKEMERSSLRFKKGQSVYIEKGAVTSFHMSREDANRRTRVKRFK